MSIAINVAIIPQSLYDIQGHVVKYNKKTAISGLFLWQGQKDSTRLQHQFNFAILCSFHCVAAQSLRARFFCHWQRSLRGHPLPRIRISPQTQQKDRYKRSFLVAGAEGFEPSARGFGDNVI